MSDNAKRSASPAYRLRCEVNGAAVDLGVPPSRRLLDVLREELELTGTKRSCDIGRCGACMVLVDGRPLNACLTMAYQCEGASVTTIEGIGGDPDAPDGLDPIQRAFLEEGGFQCGYCTPGMIIAVKALLAATPHPTDADIEEALSGNICRCTGYGSIQRAVRRAIGRGGDAG